MAIAQYNKNLRGLRERCGPTISQAKTIDVAECAMTFMVDAAAAKYNITLPSASNAGPGWWCKFIMQATAGFDIVIDPQLTASNNIMATAFKDDDASDSDEAAKSIAFDATAIKGDWIKVWTDGAYWYAWGVTSVNGGILDDQAPA